MTRALLVLVVALGGCSSNPCDGRGASCVNALVEGYAGALDQLRISIDKPSPSSTATPNPPAAFTLPVKVALVLPAGAMGAVSVGIDGLSGGQVVASAAPRTVSLPTSGTVTFTLGAGGGDGGGEDMAVPPADLAGVVSIVPASFNFAIDRGSTDMKTFHFGNGTDAAVAATATLSGGAEFTIVTDDCAGGMIAPGAGCDVTVKFAPTTSGAGKSAALTIAGAMSSITGDANPVWSIEGPAFAASSDYRALARLSGTQELAGGQSSTGDRILGNAGTSWSPFSVQPPDTVNGLAPSDGGALLVASPGGVYRNQGSTFVNELTPGDGGTISMAAVITTPAGDVAVGPAGIYRYTAGAWINDGPGHGDGGILNVTAVASDGTNFYVTAGSALYRAQPMASFTPYTPVIVNTSMPLTSVWVPPGAGPSNVWVVGDDGSIWHIASTFSSTDQPTRDTVPAGVSSPLHGIHGVRSGGAITLLAVGSGGVILRSSGDGTWTQDKSPTTANLNAVLVTSPTEAFAAGDGGTILHYY